MMGVFTMFKQAGRAEATGAAWDANAGKEIVSAEVREDELRIGLSDGSVLIAWDNGQYCCEYRHMSTDDDLAFCKGAKLDGMEIKDGPTLEEHGDPHEQQFLEVQTSKGSFTVVNHNEHNGYYGGFAICLRLEKAERDA